MVKVWVRVVREIGLGELFLSPQSSDCIVASSKTMQDGEGRKMIVIRVGGTNPSIRVKNLPSPQEISSTSRLSDGMNPVYSGCSPRIVLSPSSNRKGSERGGGRGGAIEEVGVDEDYVGILWG